MRSHRQIGHAPIDLQCSETFCYTGWCKAAVLPERDEHMDKIDNELADLIDEYLNINTLVDDEPEGDCIGVAKCPDGDRTGYHTDECNDWFWSRYRGTGTIPKSTGAKSFTWSKCRHEQKPYTLSDGTVILCSSHHRRAIELEPDLACYLDGIWKPATVAFHLGWQDYGLPYLSMTQVHVIAEELLAAARSGKRVEIGCIGGHGRTGTFLAILDLMTMETPDAQLAMDRVWDLYCKHAIESKEQEWYIEAWAADLRGEELPPKPVKPAPAPKVSEVKDTVTINGKTVPKPKRAKVERKARTTSKNNPKRGKR